MGLGPSKAVDYLERILHSVEGFFALGHVDAKVDRWHGEAVGKLTGRLAGADTSAIGSCRRTLTRELREKAIVYATTLWEKKG